MRRVVKKRGLNTSKQSRTQTSTSATVDNSNGGQPQAASGPCARNIPLIIHAARPNQADTGQERDKTAATCTSLSFVICSFLTFYLSVTHSTSTSEKSIFPVVQ
jgi:hypothetical protein